MTVAYVYAICKRGIGWTKNKERRKKTLGSVCVSLGPFKKDTKKRKKEREREGDPLCGCTCRLWSLLPDQKFLKKKEQEVSIPCAAIYTLHSRECTALSVAP